MRRALVLASALSLAAAGAAGQQSFDAGARVRAAARSYRGYGRVDDEVRWSPASGRIPEPSRARVSRAAAGHAGAVYFVYASDRRAYLRLTGTGRGRPRAGFTVVAEAFTPRELARDPDEPMGAVRGEIPGHPAALLERARYRAEPDSAGRVVGPGEPAGLFVMHYAGRRVRESDEGWIYGAVAAGGEVTAAGRIEPCVGCHRSAPHGRLFGLGP